ncbi:flavin reductase family protein [Cellulomonas chengniuliangii]|uniref:Flavin reductase family protein n=1 Tax=Cellulomonas chengniuliangii TaxID=2968084 RepID=A0ABY5L270_9CELL|nr:flavin reductase family protein [Cellulomonas chengniuliangii]MCC2307044.1 flavin reductase family protein [Cellulomonas chengniuliangii]MCC2316427.1 flavin reductase family protein [Cellulomonas chengniuliangii]UUI76153.1 flavin reductase family protein [Cellulomonas chengniuliangii]
MTDEDSAVTPVDPVVYRAAIGRLPSGVGVVSLRWRGTDHATTVSSLASVSLEPPMLLFCVHNDSRLRDALDDVDRWAVSVLADTSGPVADWLASPGRPTVGQLARVPHRTAPRSGAAWIDGAAAWLECRTAAIHPAGDHDIVVGTVITAEQGAADAGGLVHLRGRVHGVR